MILSEAQILQILQLNPNKQLLANAVSVSNKLMMHVLGKGLSNYLNRADYFENQDIYGERVKGAISNKDMFARLLQREEMVWSAQGGASFYQGLNEDQTVEFNARLDAIRFGFSIRKWIKEFSLKAYRTDPMGVIFVEKDIAGNPYPTYKSTSSIFDYLPNGRGLEYIIFRLTFSDAAALGIDTGDRKGQEKSNYYRVVDDQQDVIYLWENGTLSIQGEVITHDGVPALIVSDIIDFTNTQNFLSPLNDVVELADCYLHDRSIRNLSKKYHGFAKAIEPLLTCSTCMGTGYLSSNCCPDCTDTPGATKGSGYKLRTKVSDVARFPIDGEKPIKVQDYFAYISPAIDVWNKQDASLVDLENLARDVYWGTYSRQATTGPDSGNPSLEETATKTLADLQPVYARLNLTADWAENTENAVCNIIGQMLYADSFKGSMRTYGRYYILETPDDLFEAYLNAKSKGAPQSSLTDLLKKYYHSLYQEDKIRLSIMLKLMQVEPFIHYTTAQVQASNPAKMDYLAKMYYSEWLSSKDDTYLMVKKADALIADLYAYVAVKAAEVPELIQEPAVSESETLRSTQ